MCTGVCGLGSAALTAVCGSVWLSCLLVGVVEVEVEVKVRVEVEGLQWPSLPALGRCQGQGGGSSARLSTHERMLCRWVGTTANTSHTRTHTQVHTACTELHKPQLGPCSWMLHINPCLKCQTVSGNFKA